MLNKGTLTAEGKGIDSTEAFAENLLRQLQCADPDFPSGLRLVVAINKALANPNAPVAEIARLVSQDPFILARLVAMANCVTFNPGGQSIYAVDAIIQRLGFNVVRILVSAIAANQLKLVSRVSRYADFLERTWRRAIRRTCIARLLCQRQSGVQPDKGAFAALIVDIAHFYLVTRLLAEPGLINNEQEIEATVLVLAPQVTPVLLKNLQVEPEILEALGAMRSAEANPLAALLLRASELAACTADDEQVAGDIEIIQDADRQANELMAQFNER